MKMKLSTLFFCFLALSAQANQRVTLPLESSVESVQATVALLVERGYQDRVRGIVKTSTGYAIGNMKERVSVEIDGGGSNIPGMVGLAVMSYGADFYTSYGHVDNVCELVANADLSSPQAILYSLAQRYSRSFPHIRRFGSTLEISDGRSRLEITEHGSMGLLAVMNYSAKLIKY